MGARASKAGPIVLLVAAAALVLPAVPGVSWADPPPLGSACTIDGTAGPDVLTGTSGSDVICGNGGDDTLTGLGGDDLIIGGFGSDTIDGGSGDDDVRGGAGDDTVSGATGEDSVFGDDGDDDLTGGNDDDLVVGGLGEDDVRGNNGADRVFGREDADVLYGGDGNDVLRGGSGSDNHFGQVGDDTIYDRDGAGNVDNASCGDGTDVARVDFYDNVNADCEKRVNLDREDPVAVDDAATVTEDDAATTVDVLANDTDLDGGPITIDSVTQPTNGTVVITNSGDDLTYEPDADYCNDGSPTDDFTYTLAPGGDTATVAMTVTCVADVPVAVDDTATVDEDDPATTVDVLANDDDEGQVIEITSVTQPINGTVVITNAGADLTYETNANYCNDGSPTDDFTYTITGGDTATVAVTVTCVEDAPDAVNDTATVGEDDPATTIDVLGNDSDAEGDAFTIDQVTQPTNGTVVVTNAGADLTYEPDADYCNDGTPTDDFTYTLAPGGDTATVAVTVTCVSDPAVAADDDKTVLEDAAATTIDVLANDTQGDTGAISITNAGDPANGTVVITNGGADLTYQPDPNYCNDPPGTTLDTFTYTLGPDGDTATVTVTVTCVNDAPVADDESYTGASAAVGNTVLVHDDPTDAAPTEAGPKKSITGDLLAGDTDVDSAGPLTITAETVSSTDGGTAVIQADGDFVYTPAAGTSCTDTTDSFGYTVNDGDGGSDVGTVTVGIIGCVWYVNNSDPGNAGTSNAPFDTIAQAEAASGVNHTIYVFDGDDTTTGYATGITLKPGQQLIGERASLIVGGELLADAQLAKRPTITAGGADVVTLSSFNTVTGLQVDLGTAGGIAGGPGDTGGTLADVAINDPDFSGTQPGLELDGTSGPFAISDLGVNVLGVTGVRLNANTGTVTFADFGFVTVVASLGKALDITSTNLGTSAFDIVTSTGTSGGISLTDTTGTVTFVDLSLSTSSGSSAAFALNNAAGVTVQGSGTANVDATGGPAVDATNAPGAVLSFDTVSSTDSTTDGINLDGLGTGTFSATGGTISGAAVISFDLNGGNGDVSYPGALQNGSGATAEVTGRTGGVVSLSGTIVDSADAAGGISLNANTGGTTTFSGSTIDLDTGAGNAVSMTASDGHTLHFTGGDLDILTSTGRGFNADASGTVSVTGASNTISSTTGRALSIVSTDIAAADVTFQSISAVGGGASSQGIVLDTTGGAGNLVVTGSGGTCVFGDTSGCSGGTISGFTGASTNSNVPGGTGIVLNSTMAPSFTRMNINASAATDNYGIRGTNVTGGFTLAESVVQGQLGDSALTDHKEGGIYFGDLSDPFTDNGLTGTVNVTNTTVSGGFFTNVMVDNISGALDATFDNVDSLALNDANGDDAIQFEGIGTADMDVEYKNSTISAANGDMLQYIADGTGGGDLDLTGNSFINTDATQFTGGGGLALIGGAKGPVTMDVLNNTMRNANTNALTIIKSADVAAGTNNLTATIDNNDIGLAATANSGSDEGDGMEITTFGDGNATFAVTNNDIRQYNSSGIQFVAGSGVVGLGQFNLTISGNSIGNPGSNPSITLLQGIRVDGGVNVNDAYSTCVDFGANSITGSSDAANKDFRLVSSFFGTIRQPGYAGGNTDDAAFAAYAASQIGGGAQGTAARNGAGTYSGGGSTCP